MALICSKGGGILTPSGCLTVSGDVSNSRNWEKEGDVGLRPGWGGGGGRVAVHTGKALRLWQMLFKFIILEK